MASTPGQSAGSPPGDGFPGQDVVLVDGSTARLRALRPGDTPAVVAFYEQLSGEALRQRYLGTRSPLSNREADRLVRAGDPDHLAVAVVRGDQLLGIGQYERLPGGDQAEVAFVVDDTHRRLGIGTLLLENLASYGRRHGVRRLVADTWTTNHQMLEVFRHAGFTVHTTDEAEVTRVLLDIAPTPAALAALAHRDQVAVARSIRRLLCPRSVAVIGASRTPGTIGHELVRNLVRGGFQGPVYPVNPNATHVASLPCWPDVGTVPGPVDLAVVAVPAPLVLQTVEDCGQRHVAGLVIVSSGFAEAGEGGTRQQQTLVATARRYGRRLVGPNCFGVLNTDPGVSLNATFAPGLPVAGRLGFASQSGGLGLAILAEAAQRGVGLSSFVSMGNKADVSGNDLLAWWEQDQATDVILLYLESFGNPAKFAQLARVVGRSKPIVAVKGGRSAVGRRAASSHTAALASPEAAVGALFHQTGVVRVDTIEELFDVAQVLEGQPLAEGRRVAILTNVGGPGVLAADACVSHGLSVPELSGPLCQQLRTLDPAAGAVGNPVDLGAGASADVYRQSLELLLRSDEIDVVLVIFTPPLVARTAGVLRAITDAIDALHAGGHRHLVAVSLLGVEGERVGLQAAGRPIPTFTYPETAARALAHAATYGEWRRRPVGTVPALAGIDANEARRALLAGRALLEGGASAEGGAIPDGGAWLTGVAAMDVLAAYHIPTSPSVEVHDADAAGRAAAGFGGPVALKAVGPQIVHKSDIGGVKLGLQAPAVVGDAYRALVADLGGIMTGAVVQPMAPPGVEVIVGALRDRSFGPQILFGLGGVTAELVHDVVVRLVPLTDLDAREMLDALQGAALLHGFRGAPPVDTDALLQLLHRISRLAEDLPEVVELDCNPVIASPEGAVVVDARLRVSPAGLTDPDGTRHLR